jgi:hypothetical protein
MTLILLTKWICLHVLAWTTVAAKRSTFNRQSSVGLWLASWNGDVAAMRASIENGDADLDWKNTDDDEIGHTPLMAAAQRGNHEAVSFLIQSSCDVHATDSKGRTAKSMAQAKEQEAVVAIIEKWEDANNVATTRPPAAAAAAEEEVDVEKQPKPTEENGEGAPSDSSGGWFSSWFGGEDDDDRMAL